MQQNVRRVEFMVLLYCSVLNSKIAALHVVDFALAVFLCFSMCT